LPQAWYGEFGNDGGDCDYSPKELLVEDDDDEELAEFPPDVIALPGFDPRP
jgi:hypothetical protein